MKNNAAHTHRYSYIRFVKYALQAFVVLVIITSNTVLLTINPQFLT